MAAGAMMRFMAVVFFGFVGEGGFVGEEGASSVAG